MFCRHTTHGMGGIALKTNTTSTRTSPQDFHAANLLTSNKINSPTEPFVACFFYSLIVLFAWINMAREAIRITLHRASQENKILCLKMCYLTSSVSRPSVNSLWASQERFNFISVNQWLQASNYLFNAFCQGHTGATLLPQQPFTSHRFLHSVRRPTDF